MKVLKISEREILKAIKDNVRRQDPSWKFVAGREVLDKKVFLEKLDKDRKFQKTVINLVVSLSIDILTRKPE